MSVGLVVPTLKLCIKLSLTLLVTGILTRSWKLLLIGSSIFLFCCLFTLTKFIYKKITRPTVTRTKKKKRFNNVQESA